MVAHRDGDADDRGVCVHAAGATEEVMPRRPATVTQADIARVIRAAKQAGAAEVEVLPDGRVVIRLLGGRAIGAEDIEPVRHSVL